MEGKFYFKFCISVLWGCGFLKSSPVGATSTKAFAQRAGAFLNSGSQACLKTLKQKKSRISRSEKGFCIWAAE